MSKKQYLIILDLYNNYKEAFDTLSEEIKSLFYNHLYHKEIRKGNKHEPIN